MNYDPDSGYEDEIGWFVASSPRRHLSHREFTDLLSPLRGNLRKNVGRPRNDGSGEICHGMDRRKMAVHHLEALDKPAHAAIAIGASEN